MLIKAYLIPIRFLSSVVKCEVIAEAFSNTLIGSSDNSLTR